MSKASAPGKLILFGEHFVVYGLPAIATAIEARTTVGVEKADKYSLEDNRPETPGYKTEKYGQQLDSIKRIFKAMRINPDKTPVKIALGGNLMAASGIGASAASCSAIAAALNDYFGLGLDKETLNGIAYEGEKGYHGVPSGIDNSCSTFGGFIWFKKDQANNTITPLGLQLSLSIVIGNTGITSNTTKIVGEVKQQKEANPEKFNVIFDIYSSLVNDARAAIEKKDLDGIGKLMNKNHGLLREIGVSCKEIEELVDIALKNGALGAKLTGTGRGGLVIALVNEEDARKVATAFERAGYRAEMTKIGAEGVRVE
jgi:mevalonate kinase